MKTDDKIKQQRKEHIMNLKAIQKLSYGLYIIGSKHNGRINGQIANTVFQISSDPPTVAISINKLNLTHEFIMESKVFTVSILSKHTPMTMIGTFGFKSGRDIEKFKGIKFRLGITGSPIVEDSTVSYLECKVINSIDVVTHSVFIGQIIECDTITEDEPMTYAYYHQIKGGKSPKTAPTYVKEEMENVKKAAGNRYVCKVCGYIYDPEKKDPESGVKPETPFEELPENWVCPICNAPKEEFEKLS